MDPLSNMMLAPQQARLQQAQSGLVAREQLLHGHPLDAARTYLHGRGDGIETRLRGLVGQPPAPSTLQSALFPM